MWLKSQDYSCSDMLLTWPPTHVREDCNMLVGDLLADFKKNPGSPQCRHFFTRLAFIVISEEWILFRVKYSNSWIFYKESNLQFSTFFAWMLVSNVVFLLNIWLIMYVYDSKLQRSIFMDIKNFISFKILTCLHN